MAKRTVTLKGEDAKAFIEAKHEELVEAKRAEVVGVDSGKTFTAVDVERPTIEPLDPLRDGLFTHRDVTPDEIDEDPITDGQAEVLIENAEREIEELQAALRSPQPSKDRTLIGSLKTGDEIDSFSFAMGINEAAALVEKQWGGSLGGTIVPAIVRSLRDEAAKHSPAVKE